MDPLSRPEFLLLLLEQGDRSLEDHTRLFLLIANTTSYPDDASDDASEDGPQEDFAAIGEWTLVSKGSPLPICHVDNLARSTSNPVPSPPSRCCVERMSEPTADRRAIITRSDRATNRHRAGAAENVRTGARAGDCAHHEGASHGLCEHGVEWSPLHRGWGWAVHTSGTAGHGAGSDKLGCCSGDRTASPALSIIPAGSVQPSFVLDSLVQPWGGFSSSLPQKPALPPAPASSTTVVWQPLCSPSAHYLCGASSVALPYCKITMVRVSLDSASKAQTPPWPVDPSATPWVLAPSLHRGPAVRQAPSSLRLRLSLASTILHLGNPLLWLRLVPSSLRLRQTPSSPRLLFWTLSLRLHLDPSFRVGGQHHRLRLGSPDPPCRICSSAFHLDFGLDLLRHRWSAPWSRRPSLNLPPSAINLAVAWVLLGPSCSGSLLSLPWLLPRSWPPWTLLTGPLLGCPSFSCPSSLVPTHPSPF